jgi:signal transduction histidine kinase
MDRLISGLLQISRTGRVSMTVVRLDMEALVRSVIGSLSFQIEQAKAEVHVGNLPPCWGDEHLLNQLFSNIVGNALKYRDPDRPLVISIAGRAGALRNTYSVTDTGIGIASRHLERIWDVFYRVDWSGPVQGDGIGLSIVKRIVDKHSGRVWVDSKEGQGTAFFVELPNEPFASVN